MAEIDFTSEEFRDAAVRAAMKLGRLTGLEIVRRGDAVAWTLRAELDSRIIQLDRESSSPPQSLTTASPAPTEVVPIEPAADPGERLIDKGELARRLNVGIRTLEGMISSGRVPAFIRPSGRLVRWRAAEIDNWLRAGCPDQIAWNIVLRDNIKINKR